MTNQDRLPPHFGLADHEADLKPIDKDEKKDGSLEPKPRYVLQRFAAVMEAKLLKNDYKTSWRDLPVEALLRLLKIELQEFEVAVDFLSVADARKELVDVANFTLILWDRLSVEDQKAKVSP